MHLAKSTVVATFLLATFFQDATLSARVGDEVDDASARQARAVDLHQGEYGPSDSDYYGDTTHVDIDVAGAGRGGAGAASSLMQMSEAAVASAAVAGDYPGSTGQLLDESSEGDGEDDGDGDSDGDDGDYADDDGGDYDYGGGDAGDYDAGHGHSHVHVHVDNHDSSGGDEDDGYITPH